MAFSCPKCSEEFYDRLKYCPKCGFDFTSAQKKCPKCRAIVPIESDTCPECELNFEQWAFLLPKIIVLALLIIIAVSIIFVPVIWKTQPWLHDKAIVTEGFLRSESQVDSKIPLFLEWQSGEKYIELARSGDHRVGGTDYMNQLIPLPPSVVFHYDVPVGERVYIIGKTRSRENTWYYIGRIRWTKQGKYGWLHSTNVQISE